MMLMHSPTSSGKTTPTTDIKVMDNTGADSDSSTCSANQRGIKRIKTKQPESCDLTSMMSTFSQSLMTINTTLSVMQSDIAKLAENTTEIKNDISALRSTQKRFEEKIHQMESKQSTIIEDIKDLKDSSNFSDERYKDLNAKLNELDCKIKPSLQTTDNILALEAKIDVMEQQARACNVEISNVPERRGENLLSLVEAIGSKMKFTISSKDVVAVHRVPQMSPNEERPKNIIVRFSSTMFRDNVLSSYRKAKGLTSDQLGIARTSRTIYMNEHLTLKKKLLFRDCRKEAQKQNFKYVWVKHGTILARQSDSTPVVAVRSSNDLQKLQKGTDSEAVRLPN